MDVPRVNLSKFLTELSNMFRQSFNLLVHFQVATGVEKEEVVESTKTSRMWQNLFEMKIFLNKKSSKKAQEHEKDRSI